MQTRTLKKRKRKNDFTIWEAMSAFLLFVCPVLSLPFILKGIYERRRFNYILLAIFYGLAAYLTIPFGDLYRHAMTFFSMKGMSLADIVPLIQLNGPFLTYSEWVMNKWDIPFEYMRFFQLTETVILISVVFDYQIRHNPRVYNKSEIFIRYLVLLMLFRFMLAVLSARFGFATFQYIFGIHLIYDRRQYFWGLLFWIFAILIHPSFLFFIAVSLLLVSTIKRKWHYILVGIIFLFMATSLVSMFHADESYFGRRVEWYFAEGSSYAGDFSQITIWGMLASYASKLLLLPFAWIVWRYYNHRLWWQRYGLAWLIIALVCIPNPVLFTRTVNTFARIALFFFLSIESWQHLKKNMVRNIIVCSLLFSVVNTVDMRNAFINSRYEKLFAPVTEILSTHYSETWLERHVDGNQIIRPTHE